MKVLFSVDNKTNNLRLPFIARIGLLLLVCLNSYGCSKPKSKSVQVSSESKLDKLVTAIDKDGVPTEVEGYTENKSIQIDSKITTESFLIQGSKDEKAFEFTPPVGFDVEFSEPVPISGSFLADLSSFADCASLSYQAEEPTFASILKFVNANNLCSDIYLNFCVKLTATANQEDVFFIKTPRLNFNLICSDESFADNGVSVSGDVVSEGDTSKVDLKISAKKVVADMYITNSPGCRKGGKWENIRSLVKDWNLAPIAGVSKVYVGFRDILGNESDCLETSIKQPATLALSGDLRVSINGGASYAATDSATLTLAAAGSSHMYITNKSGCASGGSWQTYTVSSSVKTREKCRARQADEILTIAEPGAGSAIVNSDKVAHYLG